MKYTIETKNPKCKVLFEIDGHEWEDALNLSYNKTKDKYNIEGFRKGLAPRKIIEKQYGANVFFDDAFNFGFSKAYKQFLSENKDILPVQVPDVDITDIKDGGIVCFVAEFFVRPQVKVVQYKGLKVDGIKTEIDDQTINKELEKKQDSVARMVEVDRASRIDDIVNIDYKGTIDGVAFDGGTAQGYDLLLGSNSFIPGFEEQLLNLNKGDKKAVNVSFPDGYHAENLAGKAAIFDCIVNAVKFKQKPELNDNFVKDVSEFNTLQELKDDILDKLTKKANNDDEVANTNALLKSIINNTVVDIPEPMIEEQIDGYLHDFEHRVEAQGIKFEDYLKYAGMTMEQLRDMRKDDAKESVKLRLALEEIIKLENILPTQDAIDKKIEQIAKSVNKPLDVYMKGMNNATMDYIINEVTVDNALTWLKSNNEIVFSQDNKDTKVKDKKVDAELKSPKSPPKDKTQVKSSVDTKAPTTNASTIKTQNTKKQTSTKEVVDMKVATKSKKK